ncbi:hypothetical protein HDU98_004750 [Podochytrium sp. JEL0797]|nr:hypothetical protein HDU98_004750 [Podochytrium sp. JEL0797]
MDALCVRSFATAAAMSTAPLDARPVGSLLSAAGGGSALVALRNAVAVSSAVHAVRALDAVSDVELGSLSASQAAGLVGLVGSAARGESLGTPDAKVARLATLLTRLAAAGVTVEQDAAQASQMRLLFAAGRRGEALSLFAQGDKGTNQTIAAIDGLANARCAQRALRLLRAQKEPVPQQTTEAVAIALAKEGFFEDATQLLNEITDPSERVYGHIAYAYALKKNLTMANKLVNDYESKTSNKRGINCFNALIKANCLLEQPGEADLLYRDLRLQGLSATAEIYTSLIRVHGHAGNVTKAVRYLTKRDESPNSNTPTSLRPTARFQPSRNMYAAVVEAHALKGEVLLAFRTLAEAWTQYGLTFKNATEWGYMSALARHFSDMDFATASQTILEMCAASGIKPARANLFAAYMALSVAEGLTRLPAVPASAAFPPVDTNKCNSLALAIVDSVRDTAKGAFVVPSKVVVSMSPRVLAAYQKALPALATRAAYCAMSVHTSTANVSAAEALLDACVARNECSRGVVAMFLRCIAAGVEAGNVSAEEAVRLSGKGFEVVQLLGVETSADMMQSLVRIGKGEGGAQSGLMGLSVEEAVREWCGVGGVAAQGQDVLEAFVAGCGIECVV